MFERNFLFVRKKQADSCPKFGNESFYLGFNSTRILSQLITICNWYNLECYVNIFLLPLYSIVEVWEGILNQTHMVVLKTLKRASAHDKARSDR